MPGYNYDRHWLDAQMSNIEPLIKASKTGELAVIEYGTDDHKRRADQTYYQNILAAMRIHYPGVLDHFRTWLRRDHMTGESSLCIGPANLYEVNQRQTKTRSASRPRLRGSSPQGPQNAGPSPMDLLQKFTAPTQPVEGAEVMPVEGLLTEANAREWLTGAIDFAMPIHMVIDCPTTQLSTSFTASLIEELKDKGWTLDDSESAGDTITRLKLRRVGSTQEVHNV